jgi:hypothetical protein
MDNDTHDTHDAPAVDDSVEAATGEPVARRKWSRRSAVVTGVLGAVVIAGAAFGGGVAVGSSTIGGTIAQSQFGHGGPGSGTRPTGATGGGAGSATTTQNG